MRHFGTYHETIIIINLKGLTIDIIFVCLRLIMIVIYE